MSEPIKGPVEKPLVPSTEHVVEQSVLEAPVDAQGAIAEQPAEAIAAQEKGAEQASAITTTVAAPQPAPPLPKDDVTIEVEKILEDDLDSFYATLTPQAKVLFKQKGEMAASEIPTMVRSLKLNLKRALQLIRDWLLTIPGVNKFFLEQEAKIKIDELKQIVEERRKEQPPT